MTRREILLLLALAGTVVWHVLWRIEQAINPSTRSERVARIARRVGSPAPEPISGRRPAPMAAIQAPLSPFHWVRPPPRAWVPPPEPAAAPEPASAMLPEFPEIVLPPWLFEAPPTIAREPQRASAGSAGWGHLPALGDEVEDEPAELPDAGEWAEPTGRYEPERYGQVLDPFGLRNYGWVPRIGFPYWIWSEGLVYWPDYPPHHHHDTDYGYRLTPPP